MVLHIKLASGSRTSCHHQATLAASSVRLPGRVSATAAPIAPSRSPERSRSHETDVVVIGAGVGGLSAAAMLASYGVNVTVVESHTIPGGAAHGWTRNGYHFESGPSLYSGMDARGKGANPLSHIFQAIGEELDLITYDSWNVLLPEGDFLTKVGAENFKGVLQQVRGPAAVAEWQRLQDFMRPYAAASSVIPPAAFRADPAVALTTVGRYFPDLLGSGAYAGKLTQPFSELVSDTITDPFIKNWLDLLCFLLSGLPANGTIAAEVAFMFNEWYKPNSVLEFPKGGSQAMVDALVRGVTKRGGRLMLGAHVDEIMLEGGRASGVRIRGGGTVKARTAVVSNATLWDVQKLLPPGTLPDSYAKSVNDLPVVRSFMHLHIGFDATGLDTELHHIVVNTWEHGVDSEQNVVLISIPSVLDPSLAPPGKHTLHAYVPATEPYELWEGLDRRSPEYEALKENRSQVLWKAVERIIPDIRERAEVTMVGTPLTHERFLRRHRGSYGPGLIAGEGLLPGPSTPVKGLYACGDTTFPGIGLPAVAASGAIVANSLVPVWDHMGMLRRIGL